MNHAVFMGRLTRDPEVRYSQGENSMAIARYTLAVNRIGRSSQNNNEQTADFINCVSFDKAGEFAEKYFRQGMRVLVSGRIQTGSYTNKEGVKVYTTDLMIQTQEFADSKSASGDGSQPASRPEPSQTDGDGFMDIPGGVEDSNLPFN
ncbi:single-stranded DNA-binding protein [Lacrimispora sp.]|uniref:single-stranded DNA-binding protein n=1 Tax=Lacrimispora sp. TaxID=2719234 RepID=UPI00345F7BB4